MLVSVKGYQSIALSSVGLRYSGRREYSPHSISVAYFAGAGPCFSVEQRDRSEKLRDQISE